jgi:hypothetical protein
MLVVLIEILGKYSAKIALIIDNFNDIESLELQRALIELVLNWPFMAIIIFNNKQDMNTLGVDLKDYLLFEVNGYSIKDIEQLLELENLPSNTFEPKKFSESLYFLSSNGYPPLVHSFIERVMIAYSANNSLGVIQTLFQERKLPDNVSFEISEIINKTLTCESDKWVLAIISLSTGGILPGRCLVNVMEAGFGIQTPGESIQRLSHLWLDLDTNNRLSIPQVVKLHAEKWLTEEKKKDVYKIFAEQLCIFHKVGDDPILHVNSDEWLSGIFYSILAFDGKTAVQNLIPLISYLAQNPDEVIARQIIEHPLFFIKGMWKESLSRLKVLNGSKQSPFSSELLVNLTQHWNQAKSRFP